MNVDISIVGCGPVGATLANLLTDYGHSVAIFEKETEIYRAPRGIHLDDEVVRIFQNVGIVEALTDSIVPFNKMQFISGQGKGGLVLLEFKRFWRGWQSPNCTRGKRSNCANFDRAG